MQQTIQELIPFYRALSHDKVIRLVEKQIVLKNYIILQDKYYKIYIPKIINQPLPCLCAHTDTVHYHAPTKIRIAKQKLSAKEGLGGDDRNGCWLMHQMMLKRPHDFIFALFDLEEKGCIGSQTLDVDQFADMVSVFIGLDRKGKDELALYGYDSDELLDILTTVEGYHFDYGTMTDAAVLSEKTGICCFNISVGFYQNHTLKESTNIHHLNRAERLLLALPQKLWGRQFCSELQMAFLNDEPYYEAFLAYEQREVSHEEPF